VRRAWVLLLLLSLALAQGLEEKIRQAEALKAARAREATRIERELKDLDQRTQEIRARLRTLERSLSLLGREVRTLGQREARLREEIAKISAAEAKKRQEFAKRKRELAELLDLLWRHQAGSALVVLQASSFTELATKGKWLAAVSEAELELARKVKAEAEALASLARRKRALLAELEETKAQLLKKKAELERGLKEQKELLAQLDRHKKAKTLRLAELKRAERELEAELERLRQELARRRQPKLAVPKELVGRLLFPVPGGRIVKRFGEDGSAFLWIKAPRPGSPVLAAADGQVFAVVYYGNVGWSVMIQHTKDLFTQYVNLQEPPVAVGDHVEQGETIGFLGGGVLIKGDILWFRVVLFKNGSFYYADPEPYF